MFLKGYYERIGPLLDEAAAKVPHRSEPLVMSINLARKIKDPKRMGDSIDRLLALGWPGNDDYFRLRGRKQAEELAGKLREEARGKEADELLARLPAAEARDLFIRLTWDGDADYDLVIQEPLGAVAQVAMPRTVFGGSIIKNGYGNHPEEIYVCPRGFNGDYTVRITTIYTNPDKPPTRLTLETITHEGTAEERKPTHTLVPDDPQAKPVVVHLAGGRRKTVLPFLSPVAILESMFAPPSGSQAAKARKDRRQPAATDAAEGDAWRCEAKRPQTVRQHVPGPFRFRSGLAASCGNPRADAASVGLALRGGSALIYRCASSGDVASASPGQASRTILQSRRDSTRSPRSRPERRGCGG